MSVETMLKIANGRDVDLRAPRIEATDFPALAEMLAKEKRYNGATPGVEYSVVEHCCLGFDAMINAGPAKSPTRSAAPYFLMHDLAESLLKDDTTPKKRTIAEEISEKCGVLAADILAVFDGVTDRVDAELHRAAGLEWPVPTKLAAIVKHWDGVMFVTEWRDLMRGWDHPNWQSYKHIAPLGRESAPYGWRWEVARRAWMRRAVMVLPGLARLEIP